ncbi:MAG: DUF2878 family protein, partial [Thiolinea sp.]
WMLLLWPLFATTLNVSLRWLRDLPLFWSALGSALLAPLSYSAGQQLGAIQFSQPSVALAAIALGWTVLMPLLVWLARRQDGFRPPQATPTRHWRTADV